LGGGHAASTPTCARPRVLLAGLTAPGLGCSMTTASGRCPATGKLLDAGRVIPHFHGLAESIKQHQGGTFQSTQSPPCGNPRVSPHSHPSCSTATMGSCRRRPVWGCRGRRIITHLSEGSGYVQGLGCNCEVARKRMVLRARLEMPAHSNHNGDPAVDTPHSDPSCTCSIVPTP
jgi:hypothetical protein